MTAKNEISDFLKKEQKKCLRCQFQNVCKVKKYRFSRYKNIEK